MNRKQRRAQRKVQRKQNAAISASGLDSQSLMIALEPRYMFDGAAVITVDAGVDAQTDDSPVEAPPEFATEAPANDTDTATAPGPTTDETTQQQEEQQPVDVVAQPDAPTDDTATGAAQTESVDADAEGTPDTSSDAQAAADDQLIDEQADAANETEDSAAADTDPLGDQPADGAAADAAGEDTQAADDTADSRNDQQTNNNSGEQTSEAETETTTEDTGPDAPVSTGEADGPVIVFVDHRVQDHETLLDGIVEPGGTDANAPAADAAAPNVDSASAGDDDPAASTADSADTENDADSEADTSAVNPAPTDTDATYLASQDPNVIVVMINEDEDGVDVISDVLAGYNGVAAVHVLAHGGGGNALLGKTNLNRTNLDQYAEQIGGWGDALSADGDILLYGCLTAEDQTGGVEFVDSLAALTGADIAAATGKVGDGAWGLDYHTGSIEAQVIVSEPAQAAYAHALATFQVTVGGDVVDGNFTPGNLTLREAIIRANGTLGADLVEIDAANTGATITLTSDVGDLAGPAYGYGVNANQYYGDLDITDDLDIKAINGNVTIDASGLARADRVFHVYSGATVNMYENGGSGITITGGDVTAGSPDTGSQYGGGILNEGTLTLDGITKKIGATTVTTVTGNQATFGGGISNDGGTLYVNYSTIEYNTAVVDGGGIFADSGTVNIDSNSNHGNYIFRNQAGDDGGGLSIGSAATVTIGDGTEFRDNKASGDGGGIYNAGTLNIDVNDGGVYTVSAVGNVAVNGGGIYNAGTLDIYAHGDTGAAGVILEDNVATGNGGDIANSGDLYLETYAENYQARITIWGSDAGMNGGGIWNSGYTRILSHGDGAKADVAVGLATHEAVNGAGLYNTAAGTVEIYAIGDNYDGTVRFLNNKASNDGGGIWNAGTLNVNVGYYNGNYYNYGRFEVENNTAGNDGGGIHNYGGVVTLNGGPSGYLYVSDNTATVDGGGIWTGAGGTLNVLDSTIENNTATVDGGGIFADSGTVNIDPTYIKYNQANNDGGGLYIAAAATVNIDEGSYIYKNTADDHGGGIYNAGKLNINVNTGGTVSIDNNIADFKADNVGDGGGIHNAATGQFNASIKYGYVFVDDNTAFDGGGIWNAGTADIDSGDGITAPGNFYVDDNYATRDGGGVWNSGKFEVDTASDGSFYVQYNQASFDGGGVHNSGTFDVYADSGYVAVAKNFALVYGGGIYNIDGTVYLKGDASPPPFNNARVQYNEAYVSGGGIFSTGASAYVYLDNAAVYANEASYHGGGIYNYAGVVQINDSAISSNVAGYIYVDYGPSAPMAALVNGGAGGGIYNTGGGKVFIDPSVVSSNQAFIGNSGLPYAGSGGGIANIGADSILQVDKGFIYQNYAENNGGGIYNVQGSVFLSNQSFVGKNETQQHGGGVFSTGQYADVMLDNSYLGFNQARFNGGGVYNAAGSDLEVTNASRIYANIAGDKFNSYGKGPAVNAYHGGSGGGIFNDGVASQVLITDGSSIGKPSYGNLAVSGPVAAGPTYGGGFGGGIYNLYGGVSLKPGGIGGVRPDVVGNFAQYDGGGIWNRGNLDLGQTGFQSNVAGAKFAPALTSNANYGGYGGAIFNYKGDYTFAGRGFAKTGSAALSGGVYPYNNLANGGNVRPAPYTYTSPYYPANNYDFIYPYPQDTARIEVTTAFDIVDGNTSSFKSLLIDPGADGRISLREAVIAANNQSVDVYNNMPGGASTYTDYIAINLNEVAESLYYYTLGSGQFYGAYNTLYLSQKTALTVKNDPAATLDLAVYISDYDPVLLGGYLTNIYDTALIDGYANSGIFKLNPYTGIGLYDLTLYNGSATTNGGALYMSEYSYAVLDSVHVKDNTAAIDGGGIFADYGTRLFLTDDAAANNIFAGTLGRIAPLYSYSFPPATLTAGGVGYGTGVTKVSGNYAGNDGGGINLYGTAAYPTYLYAYEGTVIDGNTAGDDGGGVFASDDTYIYLIDDGVDDYKNVYVTDNAAYDDGGGIHTSGYLSAKDTTFSGNSANGATGDAAGGALFLTGSAYATISDSVFEANDANHTPGSGAASARGGAIYTASGYYAYPFGKITPGLVISNTDFYANIAYAKSVDDKATAHGGALHNSGVVDISESKFGDAGYYAKYPDLKGGYDYRYNGNLAKAVGPTFGYYKTTAAGGAIFNKAGGLVTRDPSPGYYNTAYAYGQKAYALGGDTANYGKVNGDNTYYKGNLAEAYGKRVKVAAPAFAYAYARGGAFFNAAGAYADIDSTDASKYGFTKNSAYAHTYVLAQSANSKGYATATGGGIHNAAGATLGDASKVGTAGTDGLTEIDFYANDTTAIVNTDTKGYKYGYAVAAAYGGGLYSGDTITGGLLYSAKVPFEFYNNLANANADSQVTGAVNVGYAYTKATGLGGGFHYAANAPLALYKLDFKDNTAQGYAYANSDANTAQANAVGIGRGGGLYHSTGDLTLTQGDFRNNYAKGLADTYTVAYIEAKANSYAYGQGGGVFHDGGTLTLDDADFFANSALIGGFANADANGDAFAYIYGLATGGGVHQGKGEVTVTDSTFQANTAEVYGKKAPILNAYANSGATAYADALGKAYGGGLYVTEAYIVAAGKGLYLDHNSDFYQNEANAYANSYAYGARQTGPTSKIYSGDAKAYADAYAGGGGVSVASGDVTLLGYDKYDFQTFTDNKAQSDAYAYVGPYYIYFKAKVPYGGYYYTNNGYAYADSKASGGAVEVRNGATDIDYGYFSDNEANAYGYARVNDTYLYAKSISNVVAAGGAVMQVAGTLDIDRSTVRENKAYAETKAYAESYSNFYGPPPTSADAYAGANGSAQGGGVWVGDIDLDLSYVYIQYNDAYATFEVRSYADYANAKAYADVDATGGGLHSGAGTLTLSDSTFSDNDAYAQNGYAKSRALDAATTKAVVDAIGGGVAHDGDGDITLTDSVFDANRARVEASYVYATAYAADAIADAEFTGTALGGGLYTQDGTLILDKGAGAGSPFTDNLASVSDTKVYAYANSAPGGTANARLYADAAGGGIDHGDDSHNTVAISDSYFDANLAKVTFSYAYAYTDNGSDPDTDQAYALVDADAAGGGLNLRHGGADAYMGTLSVTDSPFTDNNAYIYYTFADAYADAYAQANINAAARGGGIAHGDGEITLTDSKFDYNQATILVSYTGAYAYAAGATADTQFTGTALGGGLYTQDGTLTLSKDTGAGSPFTNNLAAVSDTNVYAYANSVEGGAADARLYADAAGGGIDHGDDSHNTVPISDSYFTGNQARVTYSYATADTYDGSDPDTDRAYALVDAYAAGGGLNLRHGGADADKGALLVTGSPFTGNQAYVDRTFAAAYADADADADIKAGAQGGGIAHGDGDLTLTDNAFDANSATVTYSYAGATAYAADAIADAQFTGTALGGGLYTKDGTLKLDMDTGAGSPFANNYASVSFGYVAAYANSAPGGTANATLHADAAGGGIDHGDSAYNTVSISDSGFNTNQAYVYNVIASADTKDGSDPDTDTATALVDAYAGGGGLHTNQGILTVTDSPFEFNDTYVASTLADAAADANANAQLLADTYGGGVAHHGDGSITLTDSAFTDNSAYVYMSKAYADAYATGAIADAEFKGTALGGGLYTQDGTLTLTKGATATGSPFSFNTAYANNNYVTANANSTPGGTADARLYADVAGGGFDHGDDSAKNTVSISDSAFKSNQAYVEFTYAYADTKDGSDPDTDTASALVDIYASGAGLNMQNGTLSITDSAFETNEMYVYYTQADAVSDANANAQLNVDMNGAGVAHQGTGDITLTDSAFYFNRVRLWNSYAYADAYAAAAIADAGFDGNAFGGGLYAADGALTVTSGKTGTGSPFSKNYVYIYYTYVQAYANSAPDGKAYAEILADVAGGGIDHGDGDVTITDSPFDDNKAFIYTVSAIADADLGPTASIADTQFGLTAYGGGVHTGGGALTLDDGAAGIGSAFTGNQALIGSAYYYYAGNYYYYGVSATATGYSAAVTGTAFAAGGGVDHAGTTTASIIDSPFTDNLAYVYEVYGAATSIYGDGAGTAYTVSVASVDLTTGVTGGGVRTAANDVTVGEARYDAKLKTYTGYGSPFTGNQAHVGSVYYGAGGVYGTAVGHNSAVTETTYAYGGGLDQGKAPAAASLSLISSPFTNNLAYVYDVYGAATSGIGFAGTGYALATAKVLQDTYAYGGGVRTPAASLVIGAKYPAASLVIGAKYGTAATGYYYGGSAFSGNRAFIGSAFYLAGGVSGTATGYGADVTGTALAAGGGVDQSGTTTASILSSPFTYNYAYVYDVYGGAFSAYGDAAGKPYPDSVASVDLTTGAAGGGVRTAANDVGVGALYGAPVYGYSYFGSPFSYNRAFVGSYARRAGGGVYGTALGYDADVTETTYAYGGGLDQGPAPAASSLSLVASPFTYNSAYVYDVYGAATSGIGFAGTGYALATANVLQDTYAYGGGVRTPAEMLVIGAKYGAAATGYYYGGSAFSGNRAFIGSAYYLAGGVYGTGCDGHGAGGRRRCGPVGDHDGVDPVQSVHVQLCVCVRRVRRGVQCLRRCGR